jgi:hypothetical protein
MPAFGSEAAIIFLTDTAIIRTDIFDPTMVPTINRIIATIMGRHTTGITDSELITATTIIITTTIKMCMWISELGRPFPGQVFLSA